MNSHLHRVIFNAARGLRMVVQETASRRGRAANQPSGTPPRRAGSGLIVTLPRRTGSGLVITLAGLSWIGLPAVGFAQILPHPLAAGAFRPQVLFAPSGVPLVNIAAPTPAGVSINSYSRFDIQAAGAVLNNSRSGAATQLGGVGPVNPWLVGGPARVIVNQVISSQPSLLNGPLEVAGARAEVIVANPSGIQVNGGGFINASRATLTTGVPQYGVGGSLDGYVVRSGTVRIEGEGLDAGRSDYAANVGYNELKDINPGTAKLVLRTFGVWATKSSARFDVSASDEPCKGFQHLGSASYTGSGVVYPWVARVARVGSGASPYLVHEATPGLPIQVRGSGTWNNQGVFSGPYQVGTCVPATVRFTPMESHAYTVEFEWPQAMSCRLSVMDATDPDTPKPVEVQSVASCPAPAR